MSNLNKSKKDKEILAEYESQVKGKLMVLILNDTVTPTIPHLCTRMKHTTERARAHTHLSGSTFLHSHTGLSVCICSDTSLGDVRISGFILSAAWRLEGEEG